MSNRTQTKKYGFKPDIQEDDQYVLGAALLPTVELMPRGQWDEYLPTYEFQSRDGLETYNCTAYGTLNAIEILFMRVFGERKNFSERYPGILAGTMPPGNSPHKVMETIRTFGLVDDSDLPFSSEIKTIEEYYSPNPMVYSLIKKGKKWKDEFEFKHEWVYKTGDSLEIKQKKLIEALRYSPVAISVHAWKRNAEGVYYKDKGDDDNHWCVLYGFDEGFFWKIFDTYDGGLKLLEWNYDFMQAKRIHLVRRTSSESRSVWSIIKEFINDIFI